VREYFFSTGFLPAGEDHNNPQVQSFTQSLGIYLQHFGVCNEGGLRSIVPRVLHAGEVADTSPVSPFNCEANINALRDLVNTLKGAFKKHRRFMMKATDTVLLGEILEGSVCNVTTTGGYQSVPAEKPKIKDVTFKLLVKASDN
jgi:hypothetical protein